MCVVCLSVTPVSPSLALIFLLPRTFFLIFFLLRLPFISLARYVLICLFFAAVRAVFATVRAAFCVCFATVRYVFACAVVCAVECVAVPGL